MAKRVREIRAVYDGKVLVPQEPLDLVQGQQVELDLKVADSDEAGRSIAAIRKLAGMANCPSYDPTKFDRGELYP